MVPNQEQATKIDFTTVGKMYTSGKYAKFCEMFDGIEWIELPSKGEKPLELPAMPGMGIESAIKELRIPKVSHVGFTNRMAPFGLLAIFGHYKDAAVKVFICDEGSALIPLAMEVHERN